MNKKTIITILLALVALVGQWLTARKSIRYENIAPITSPFNPCEHASY